MLQSGATGAGSVNMQSESTRILFDYWNELREGRNAPERREIEPTRIRSALSNTFILEAIETGEFSFRLAGSHLCSAYCRELKNRSFSTLWHDKDRDAIGTLIRAVTDDSAVALVTFEGTTANNNKMSFELVLLPISHNGTTQTRLLGGLSGFDEPYWFGAQPILEQRITGLRLIWPDDLNQPQFTPRETYGDVAVVGGTQAEFTGIPAKIHGRDARRYNHLAVIDGGRQ